MFSLRNRKRTMFLSSYRNTSGSLGEREMLWEHELPVSDFTAFLSSPKLVFKLNVKMKLAITRTP